MRRSILLAALGILGAVTAAPAQPLIQAGMTVDQVRAQFGAPAATRAAGEWTYLYYHNGCPNRCGSDDVVFMRDGRVVAAVLRTGRRRFAGPGAATALEQAGGTQSGRVEIPRTGAREVSEGPPVRMQVRRRFSDSAAVAGVDDEPEAVVGDIRVTAEGTEDVSTGGRIERLPMRRGAGARDTILSDAAAEPEIREREERMDRNVIQSDTLGTDPAFDRDRRRREEAVAPRTIRPKTARPGSRP